MVAISMLGVGYVTFDKAYSMCPLESLGQRQRVLRLHDPSADPAFIADNHEGYRDCRFISHIGTEARSNSSDDRQ